MVRSPSIVRCRGRKYDVQETVRLRGRPYWVTASLGNRGRRKLQVFDPAAQDLRVIHCLPVSSHTQQQLRVLRRAGRGAGFVQIIDVESRRDEVWVLTDWIHGEPLSSHISQARKYKKYWPSAHMSWTLYSQFAHAVSQFHDFSMCVHADIKPANLILQGKPRRLRLIDFGSAWNEEVGKRRDSGDGNSLGYASPELFADGGATVLADQFSATVVLYEMLTGELPYQGMGGRAGWPEFGPEFEDAFEVPSRKSPNSEQLPRRAWRSIDEVARRSLSLDPAVRFQTSNEWRDAVDRVTQELRRAEVRSPWRAQLADAVDRAAVFLSRPKRSS